MLGQGRLAEAGDYYRRALELVPTDALAHVNLGYVLLELDELEAAGTNLVKARELDEKLVDAHFLLGRVLVRQKELPAALQSFRTAVALKPDFDFAWLELGNLNEQLGDVAAALDDYTRALAVNPLSTAAADGKVRMLLGVKRWDEAVVVIDAQPESENNYWFEILKARALHGLKNYSVALELLENVLAQRPDEIQALHCKAGVMAELQRFGEALEIYRQIVALKPDYAEALSNAAAMCEGLGNSQEAMGFHEKAIALKPDDAMVLRNLGSTLLGQGRYLELVAMMDRGLLHHPENADIHYHKAWGSLLLGDLRQGLAEFEWRWSISTKAANTGKPPFPQPQWRGESISGKTLLLHWEQGLGDSIQMLRYLPLLAGMGAQISLVIQPALVPLCSPFDDICTLIDGQHIPRVFDYHCTLLSLPFAFGTVLETIPSQIPYLFSEKLLRSDWQEKLGPRRKPRVGLVWSGNADHLNDKNRSMPLQVLLDCLPDHIQWVALQKEIRPSDREALEQSSILDASRSLGTFADTAALVDCMDLVISVDTSVAHLAGAMGKQLWLLLPHSPDWRWMHTREDTPWYPDARLFRQGEDRQWGGVAERMAEALLRMFPSETQASIS